MENTLKFNISNGSETFSPVQKEIWTAGNISFLIFAVTLIAITIIGNGMIIAAWFIHKPLRTSSNLLLVSLAIPDILLGLISMPLNTIQIIYSNWFFGQITCQLWAITNITFGFVSANHLVLIAFDRYNILFYGIAYLQRRNHRRALTSILFVWFVGLCVASPYIFSWRKSVEYFSKNNA